MIHGTAQCTQRIDNAIGQFLTRFKVQIADLRNEKWVVQDNNFLPNGIFVGAHEHREAAIAVCQVKRNRGLAVLVRSYRLFVADQNIRNSG
jgi:hypothetical protein